MPIGWMDDQPDDVKRTLIEFGRYCEHLEQQRFEALMAVAGMKR